MSAGQWVQDTYAELGEEQGLKTLWCASESRVIAPGRWAGSQLLKSRCPHKFVKAADCDAQEGNQPTALWHEEEIAFTFSEGAGLMSVHGGELMKQPRLDSTLLIIYLLLW